MILTEVWNWFSMREIKEVRLENVALFVAKRCVQVLIEKSSTIVRKYLKPLYVE